MSKLKEFYREHKSFLIISIVMLMYYIQHIISFRLGMNFEESRDANAYLLAIQGYLPYRDFEWLYGPFSFFVYPFIMKIFGINLIVLRISYIIFASLVIPLAYFLARRIMPCFWAGIAAFLSIIFFDVPYYTFNHIFTVLGEIGCLLAICRFIEVDKRIYSLFWAGVFTAITILTKPLLSGLSLFVTISLFLFLVRDSGLLQKRFKCYLIFVIATIFWVLMYFLYFYFQTKHKNIPVAHSSFAQDSALFLDHLPRAVSLIPFSLLLKRLKDILPIHNIINISSFAEFKQLLVISFDNFIFFLPFIASILILLIYIISKFNWVRPELKEKVFRDKNVLLLFVLSAILISLEGLMLMVHRFSRAYTMQVPFILVVYILYLIKTTHSRRPVITATFIALFLFYLSGLHFFRYPYSMVKKYTEPLNLDRAKGILLTLPEKKLYESLSSYLSLNFNKEDKMVIIGYYPQFSFLTKHKDIFEDEVYTLPRFEILLATSIKTEKIKSALASFEDRIISKMEKEKPKIVLSITDNYASDFKSLSSKVAGYIEKNYSLDKIFGPADVFGLGGTVEWVKLYKYKN